MGSSQITFTALDESTLLEVIADADKALSILPQPHTDAVQQLNELTGLELINDSLALKNLISNFEQKTTVLYKIHDHQRKLLSELFQSHIRFKQNYAIACQSATDLTAAEKTPSSIIKTLANTVKEMQSTLHQLTGYEMPTVQELVIHYRELLSLRQTVVNILRLSLVRLDHCKSISILTECSDKLYCILQSYEYLRTMRDTNTEAVRQCKHQCNSLIKLSHPVQNQPQRLFHHTEVAVTNTKTQHRFSSCSIM